MAMKVEMIDELLKDCKTSEDIFGENGLAYLWPGSFFKAQDIC